MKWLVLILVLGLAACSDYRPNNQENETTDTVLTVESDTTEMTATDIATEQQIVTKVFFDLVKYLDSSGFICDSARFAKTYQRVNQERLIRTDNYLFYELKLAETVPIKEHMYHVKRRDEIERNRKDTAQHQGWHDWKERWELNNSLFEKAEKIIAYFYVEKTLFNGTDNGTHYDGIIEEWKFPHAASAKEAAEDLAKKGRMVYTNRGAYVCHLDNCMYIFHSRSAGFYTPLKKFLNHFADKNNATVPYRKEQRNTY